jgi:hypothetical protein
LAILDGEKKRQIILADLGSPRGKSAENTRHKSWPAVVWRQRGERFGLAHFSNGLWFFDDFSKLTWHLGHVLPDSFSGIKACSFDVFCDLGRWLFIVGQ